MLSRGTSHRKLPVEGSFMEPRKKGLELIGRRCGQDEANEAQSGEEETKTRPRRAKIGSTWGQGGAKTGQDGAKTGQDGTKMGQEWAKLDKSWRDWAEVGQKSCRSCREWAKMGTREAEMGPRWSKMKLRGSQDEAKNGSKTGQDGAKIRPRQARAVQDRPKVGQE